MQRRGEVEPVSLTLFSYGTPNGRFLAHGRYYLELIGAKASDSLMMAAEEMAKAFINKVGADQANVMEMELFPVDNLIEGSRSLVASDAFGITGFNQVFTAKYNYNGSEITAYITQEESEDGARVIFKKVKNFYLEFGGTLLNGTEREAVIDILDTIEVLFYQGKYLIGVHEAPDQETAVTITEQFKKRLEEIGDDKS